MRYAQIRSMDISNGEGIGVSLFVQGCHFHCKNCFNQETWDFTGGKEWTEETQEQFYKLIEQPYVTRVSFLGGEPLADENLLCIFPLIHDIRLKYPDKKIWLYTGYEFDSLKMACALYTTDIVRRAVVRAVDVLVAGPYKDDLRDLNLKWCGSSNQEVIDIPETLEQGHKVLWTN